MSSTVPTVSSRRLAAVLFCCLFASQAGLVVLSPMLDEVARDLGVSTAIGGQLRAVSGAAGGIAALIIGFALSRARLRALLQAGLAFIAAGSLLSAVAPGFAVLVIAQVGIGAGAAALLAGGIAAAGAWSAPDERIRVLTWTIVGQPASWVVGLPIAGVVDKVSWRLTWVAVPLLAALMGMVALRRVVPASATPEPERPRAERGAWRDPSIRSWALGELFANSAWAGTLVYCGALLVESYGWTASAVSFALAGTAVAYFPGAFAARRLAGRDPRAVLAVHALALSAGVAVFAGVRIAPAETIAAFVVLAVLSGARSVVTSSFGLDAAPAERVAVMSMRTATLQFGYFIGAGLGGLALAIGGYDALAVILSALFALGAVPHLVHLVPRPRWTASAGEDDLVAELG